MSSMKIDRFLKKEEVPDFLRELAEAMENGEGDLGCASEFRKIKVRVKDEYGQVSLRVKIKSADECAPGFEEDAEGSAKSSRPRYKDLKDRMGDSFKVIFKMIHQGKVPPRAAVEEFLEDSRLMVTYTGYGDPYYDVYIEACDVFARAYESGDIVELNKAVDVLVHQKGHCHAKYK